MAQVVAVMNYETGQARFAGSLTSVFRRPGFDLLLRTHHELVAEVNVEQSVGQEPCVEPDRPLLWLSPGNWSGELSLSPDGRFLAAETIAAARSIAMLTRSPVLNRPTAVSSFGRFPGSPVLAVRQARQIPFLLGAVRAECFTSTPPAMSDGADDGDLEVYDYSAGRSSYGPGPEPIGPFRHRRAVPGDRLGKVHVVGTRAIPTTAVPAAAIDASLQIASWYQLDLVTVWWLVDDDDAPATLARIDCPASDLGLDESLDQVAEAVLVWLCDSMAHRTDA